MSLPLVLLLGLLVAAANQELLPAVPGTADWQPTGLTALALLAPLVFAAAARLAARQLLLSGRRALPSPTLLLRLSALATPVAVHVVFAHGHYGDLIDAWSWNHPVLGPLLAVLPAYLAELPRLVFATSAQLHLEIVESLGPLPLGPRWLPQREEVLGAVRLRLGWPLLLLMPITLLGLVPEVLQAHRSSFVFALVTTPGVMLAGVVLLLASVLLLPWCFRFAFGPRPLPEPAGGRLRETARRLDFPPGSVLQLPTGMRTLNAMMVGPLPFGRCLCITDGLLRTLDVEALNGVVAHEVGHARAGHPGLLLTIALVLSATALAAVRCLELDQQAPFVQAGLLLGGMLLVWAIVRSMAHRFEHEADAASVDALGAGPCTEALRVVSRLAMPVAHGWLGRATSLHPEEPARWQFMRRYELDPAFRADFVASGRRLRFGILAAAAGAMVITGLGWSLDWPFEQARWRLHAGDVVAAHELAQAAPAVPKRWQPAWLEFEQDLRVARELAPEARDWATAQARYAAAGWSRGEAELLAKGPAAARAWFGCALAAIEHPTAVQRAIYAFCAAADDIDLDRMEAVKVTLQRLGVPERLAPVFADPPPR